MPLGIVRTLFVCFALIIAVRGLAQTRKAVPSKSGSEQPHLTVHAPTHGDQVVRGHAENLERLRVRVYDGAGSLLQTNDGLVSFNGDFFAGLAKPLAAGQIIQVTVLDGQKETIVSSPPMLVPNTPLAVADAERVPITDAVAKVNVKASPVTDGAVKPAIAAATVPASTPAKDEKSSPQANASESANPLVQSDTARDFVLGGMRYYFTFGAVLSKQGSDFSQTNPFLDFQLDRSWLSGLHRRYTWNDRLGVHTFFDARLTAVGSSERQSSQNAGTTQKANLDSFLTTRKAGALGIGIYAPLAITPLRRYSFYVAPIFKAGFITPTDSSDQTVTTNVASATTTSIVTPRKFFTYGAYGVRLGEQEHIVKQGSCGSFPPHGHGNPTLDGCIDRTMAASTLSYLDITVGKYANFESFQQGLDAANNPLFLLRQRPNRIGVEGILQIPNTPIVLGVSANVAGPGGVRRGYTPPQDDLRFLLGLKFDAKRIVNALVDAGENAQNSQAEQKRKVTGQ